MGGQMRVESASGQGSTFHFEARFDRPHAASAVRTAEPRALRGLRVLVVDDNDTNRRILLDMLANWRMTADAAAGATAALDRLRAGGERFDLVITDAQMPDVDGFSLARSIRKDPHLRTTPIVMLTSMGDAEHTARIRRLGIHAWLVKPVKQSDLLDTLATIFGAAAGTVRAPANRPPARAPSRAAAPMRVLVAEDNAVNRKLVCAILRKRGHTVKAVEHGRAAVAAAAAGGFDAILMDLQMPEMGGLEATRAIRAREDPAGPRVPIVALTAHAMPGDRERCLEAGMDAYLAKPIEIDALITTIEGLRRPAAGEPPAAADPAPESAPATPAPAPAPKPRATVGPTFDERDALKYTGGDRDLLREIIRIFRADVPSTMTRIARAVSGRDAGALRAAAHTLKGASATVGAARTRAHAAALEDMGRANRLGGAGRALKQLRQELPRLDAAFVAAGLAAAPRRTRPAPRASSRTERPRARTRRRR
jgi:CheY-like chemotaxis protein/HPt (histidine-containing phosphotransfer) domain-containing protein